MGNGLWIRLKLKRKQVTVSYGKTFNLGNYESERIDLSITQEIEHSDSIPDLIDAEFKYLKIKVNNLRDW